MMTRRAAVEWLAALGLSPVLSKDLAALAALESRFRYEAAPFALGVASGDPSPKSVILWTRLLWQAPFTSPRREPSTPEVVGVEWAIATDVAMRNVVASGTTMARRSAAHSVHVDAAGLRPGTQYFYRFSAAGRSSRIGRTRTAPEGCLDSVRFACLCCQDFDGEYGAFLDVARQPVDFVVHLGDSIYEWAWDGRAADDLPSFRHKHALFRGDPLAREAWAAHPFIVTWDDHEVRDNYSGRDPQFDALRGAAYRAFYEHMPVRLPGGEPDDWKSLPIYRGFQFGDLLDLAILDLRQYRDPPPSNGQQLGDPARTMLGESQKRWLLEGIGHSRRAWMCIASSVFMGDYNTNLDAWEGYPHERLEVLRAIEKARSGRVVVASGDSHRSIASRLMVDGTPVGMEFNVPAISSRPPSTQIINPDLGFRGRPLAPGILYEDAGFRGYMLCEVFPERWRSTYRVLRDSKSSCMTQLASFETPLGAPKLSGSGFVPFGC
jgi:alkaline phosphatase D